MGYAEARGHPKHFGAKATGIHPKFAVRSKPLLQAALDTRGLQKNKLLLNPFKRHHLACTSLVLISLRVGFPLPLLAVRSSGSVNTHSRKHQINLPCWGNNCFFSPLPCSWRYVFSVLDFYIHKGGAAPAPTCISPGCGISSSQYTIRLDYHQPEWSPSFPCPSPGAAVGDCTPAWISTLLCHILLHGQCVPGQQGCISEGKTVGFICKITTILELCNELVCYHRYPYKLQHLLQPQWVGWMG